MVRNKGFSIVEVLIIVLVLALIGFIGWKVWDSTNNPPSTDETTTQQAPKEIKTEEDLDKADKTLDETNIEGDEANQLETEVSF